MNKLNILITSSGRRSYIVKYFKQAIGDNGEIHASNSYWSPALEVADKAVITPLIYDDKYIEFLLDYCLKNNIIAIISLFDIDLPILAKNKNIFEKKGIKVLVSDYKVTQICNDKWETFKFLNEHEIMTPNTFISIESVLKKISDGIIKFPLILKPRWGMGSIGIYQADNIKELRVFYNKVKERIRNTYLKYESSIDLNNSVIIQEKIHGQEYGLNVINNLNKEYVTTLVQKKIAMRAGETDRAITENNHKLRKLGEKIAIFLKHILNLDVDCFLTNKMEAIVLEMNCRIGGLYPFSHLAGANLPLAIIKWIKGESKIDNLLKVNYGIEGVKDIVPTILKKI
ncbi:MAG: ATP-grasp domain-containing protein [Promethearchaeota archaeon]